MDDFQPPPEESLRSKGRVTTLGMFIIDHFEMKNEHGEALMTLDAQIGGGGIFGPFDAYGLGYTDDSPAFTAARLFLPPCSVGQIVDQGDDFPSAFKAELEHIGGDGIFFRPREGDTTRALNMYSGQTVGEGHQSFRYLTPQKHLVPQDLLLPPCPFGTPRLPEWVHSVCVTERAEAVLDQMDSIRRDGLEGGLGKGWDGKLLWEPLGRCCNPEHLDDIVRLAPRFAVFSPNLLELQSILSISPEPHASSQEAEDAAQAFHDLVHVRGAPSRPTIIVRAGSLGAYTISDSWTGWTPAFWTAAEQSQVVDPTGGGNGFMGGLMAGLLLTGGDMRAATVYASVGASFIIQQRGIPVLERTPTGEQWNGDNSWRRLRVLADRMHKPD